MSDSNLKQKNVFVILGMARSGTSAIARGLKAIGIDLGEHLKQENQWNPKGFWEDNEIMFNINNSILSALHYSWDSVRLVDSAQQLDTKINPIKELAGQLLAQRFSTTDYWAFKDPRTAKILAFWQSVFNAHHINDHYIIALRNPLSSAYSYQRLMGADLEHGLMLWVVQYLSAIEGTQAKQRLIVSYDLLMQNPRRQLDRIKQSFNLPLLTDPAEIDAYADGFLDKSLQRFEYSVDDLQSHSALTVAPLCLRMYELLLRVAKDELAFDDAEFVIAWQSIKDNFAALAPIYLYVDMLLQRNDSLNKATRALHKSRLWKLIYPLRKIDALLRSYKKKPSSQLV